MKTSTLAAALALSVLPALVLAQVAPNPVADALRANQLRMARNRVADAQPSPAHSAAPAGHAARGAASRAKWLP